MLFELINRSSGMHTAYIQRPTEDLDEDMSVIRKEVDLFFDGTRGGDSCGLAEVADYLAG